MDPVAAVLGADAASTALNIEMANLPASVYSEIPLLFSTVLCADTLSKADAAGELPEAPIAVPQLAATPTGVRSATSGTLSTRHQLPPDVLMAYRSTVATTAGEWQDPAYRLPMIVLMTMTRIALLPAILRGGPRPRAPVLPI